MATVLLQQGIPAYADGSDSYYDSVEILLALNLLKLTANRRSDAFGHFPVVSPKLPAKSRVTRNITVFNDEFSAGDILLRWDVREGSLSNWVCASGEVPLSVAPGEHKTVPVTFPTPRYNSYVFLTLTVVKNGEKRYTDSYSCYEVTGGEDFSLEINGEARVFL